MTRARNNRNNTSNRVCLRCRGFEAIEGGSDICERCVKRELEATASQIEARQPVVPTATEPELDERLSELLARRKITGGMPAKKRAHLREDHETDHWWTRRRGGVQCWHCHRGPGVPGLGGLCLICGGQPMVQQETNGHESNGVTKPEPEANRLESIQAAGERHKRARELVRGLGPDANERTINKALAAEGLSPLSSSTICSMRDRLFPDRPKQPRPKRAAQAAAPPAKPEAPPRPEEGEPLDDAITLLHDMVAFRNRVEAQGGTCRFSISVKGLTATYGGS